MLQESTDSGLHGSLQAWAEGFRGSGLPGHIR